MSAQEKKERVQADIAALRPLDHGDMGCFEQRHARVGEVFHHYRRWRALLCA